MRFLSVILIICLSALNYGADLNYRFESFAYTNSKMRSESFKRGGSRLRTGRSKKKSKNDDSYLYFVKSLVLPGWGEYDLNEKGYTKFFATIEVSLILAALGLKYYSNLRTDDYKEFAQVHAGVKVSGRKDDFWTDIGNFHSVQDYNYFRAVKRDFGNMYENQDDYWLWDKSANRKRYDDTRIEAENANTFFYYAIGAIFVNHVASALNSSYLAKTIDIRTGIEKNQEGDLKSSVKLGIKF